MSLFESATDNINLDIISKLTLLHIDIVSQLHKEYTNI